MASFTVQSAPFVVAAAQSTDAIEATLRRVEWLEENEGTITLTLYAYKQVYKYIEGS